MHSNLTGSIPATSNGSPPRHGHGSHRQHQHQHQHHQSSKYRSNDAAAAADCDMKQQPAVWTWLNALGADGVRMMTPSYPGSPAATKTPVESPNNSTSGGTRPQVRRQSTAPTDSFVAVKRNNLAAHTRQHVSTSGVLFGISGLSGLRSHDEASNKRKNGSSSQSCTKCYTTATPEWRDGPAGAGTLCNVCGLVFAKKRARKDRDSWSLVNNARGGF